VLSYLPGRRDFAVQLTPTPAIARVTGKGRLSPAKDPLHRPAFDDTYGVTVTVVGNRPVPDAVLSFSRTSAPPVAGPTTPRLAAFWGDQQATEVVAAPQDPARWLRDQLPALNAQPCSWCEEPQPADAESCVFCGNVAR
jgi:hypothetical protein